MASDARRNPNMRENGQCASLGSVRRQAHALMRCDSPTNAITGGRPHPTNFVFSSNARGPAWTTKKTNSATPIAPRTYRVRKRGSGRELDTAHLFQPRHRRVARRELYPRKVEHFGSIDVLPGCILDIVSSQLPIRGHVLHAIRQRTIAVLHHGIERIEDCWSAQKHSGVGSIV